MTLWTLVNLKNTIKVPIEESLTYLLAMLFKVLWCFQFQGVQKGCIGNKWVERVHWEQMSWKCADHPESNSIIPWPLSVRKGIFVKLISPKIINALYRCGLIKEKCGKFRANIIKHPRWALTTFYEGHNKIIKSF